ncbi:hypothetical protein L1987_83518 [Smallanthus sonchifolius]|uniref:Uncharacterized protein n=1 Tax=Smallanthus sonchifolius TaxID=185202 RepID=A0ACB8YC57_9ASTR|nr:hypothetical protein L1987_83518 [Smallanthus sonchifolius]
MLKQFSIIFNISFWLNQSTDLGGCNLYCYIICDTFGHKLSLSLLCKTYYSYYFGGTDLTSHVMIIHLNCSFFFQS